MSSIKRRDFLKVGIAGIAGIAAGFVNILPAQARQSIGHSISIRSAHTGETFNGVYRVGSYYVPAAFRQINRIMRDHRTNDLHPIDPRLIDVLARLQRQCRCNEPLTILSGYRSASTNALLRRASHNVARNSFHIKGQAADIRVPGSSASHVRSVAMNMRAGGVGYYPRAAFVHVDTGDIRHWTA